MIESKGKDTTSSDCLSSDDAIRVSVLVWIFFPFDDVIHKLISQSLQINHFNLL